MSKYQRWHDQIIARARGRVLNSYFELHHIKPISFGGVDVPENRVDLTYREHFLVHWLLSKIHTSGQLRRKAAHALWAVSRDTDNPERSQRIAAWQKRVCRRRVDALRELVNKDLEKLPRQFTRKRDELKRMTTEFLHTREGYKQLFQQ